MRGRTFDYAPPRSLLAYVGKSRERQREDAVRPDQPLGICLATGDEFRSATSLTEENEGTHRNVDLCVALPSRGPPLAWIRSSVAL